MSDYTQGDVVELPAEFRDADTGALIDPDTVKLRVVAPDDSATTYDYPGPNITRVGVGTFLGSVDADQAGLYVYEWVLTGNVQGVEPADFYVEAALPANAAHRRVRARLGRLTAAAREPLLTVEALDDILAANRLVDPYGRLPTDLDWIPTYDLNAAAADGWGEKAGIAAGDYSFTAAGKTFNRHQVHAMCLAMEKRFRRRGFASVCIRPGVLPPSSWPEVQV